MIINEPILAVVNCVYCICHHVEFGPSTAVHVRYISHKIHLYIYTYIHIARRIPPVGDFFIFLFATCSILGSRREIGQLVNKAVLQRQQQQQQLCVASCPQ
ncbi:hypothetical protein QTP88_022116 [Uroleucon formosanum]